MIVCILYMYNTPKNWCKYIMEQARTEGGFVGFVRTPPLQYLCKQKSEPNHFVAVQDLIEGSEVEASLKRLEVPSYAPYCPPFCYGVIG